MPNVSFSSLCGFTAKQWVAAEAADTHSYTLFGGSRGPGKSYFLRWYLLRRLLRWAAEGHRNVRVMMACEDYPSLYERQLSKVQTEFPAWLGSYYAQRNEFRLAPAFGSGIIAFRNLDDASKYMSAEFAGIAIDEISKNNERTFHVLRGSLRWPGVSDSFMVAATNPSANWVRSYWIEKRFPEELQPDADKFAFIPALPTDNPHLAQGYWDMLNTLPGAMRQSWLHGDWYAGVEGLVYGDFSDANITDAEPDPALPIELAIDDGYVDPRATLFVQRLPGGDILIFDELYQTKTLEERTVQDIIERCEANKWRRPELAAVSHEAPALRERLRQANIPARSWLVRKVTGGDRSTRIAAIKRTRALICDGQGHRAIKVHKRCRNLLDELMAGYKYPDGKRASVDDAPADGNDHAAQAMESWIWLRMGR